MRYVLSRLTQALVLMFCVATVLFLLLRSIPGNPAATLAGPGATPHILAAISAKYGFDKPLPVQYIKWLGQLVQGNFGISIVYQQPVLSLVAAALQPTLQLLLGALLIALVTGGALGILAAVYHRRAVDIIIGYFTAAFIGIPIFWTGLLAVLIFAVRLHFLPSAGAVNLFSQPLSALKDLVLPSVTLGLGIGSNLARFVRTSMLGVLDADYVRTARAKGAAGWRVIWHHALRNALIPIVTILGIQLGALIGGAVVIESVFARPGMGLLLTSAISGRDYPVVEGVIFILVGTFSICNLIVDLLYGVIDPRVRR